MNKIGKVLTSTVVALSLSSVGHSFAATDIYKSYAGLSSDYKEGKDYVIETQEKQRSNTIVLAIHGGRIEKGTDELAKAVAQDDHSYYVFKALKYHDKNEDQRNDLHITSKNFDEPFALRMTAKRHKVVSIHGAKGTEELVYMGGNNKLLRDNIAKELKKAGFQLEEAPEHLNGNHPNNIVNKSRNLQGAQMELTTALREKLLENEEQMKEFANAVRRGIDATTSYPNGRTYDFGMDDMDYSWLNEGKPFYLTPDDYIQGVQGSFHGNNKVRFDFYDETGKKILSRTAHSDGHRWFIHKTGLKAGYYKIQVVNVSGNPTWLYGGLVY